MDQEKMELLVSLLIVAVGSCIMGAAAVGIQLEKIKRQRDEALKRLEELEKNNGN